MIANFWLNRAAMRLPDSQTIDKMRKTGNIGLPFVAAGAVYANMVCDVGCTYIYGTLFGLDLHLLGFILAGAILLLSLPLRQPIVRIAGDHLRANLLAAAVGGGVVLLHFQMVNRIFCPFCLVYGALAALLFLLNVNRTSGIACAVSFAAGLLLFVFFFEGSAVPVFDLGTGVP